MNDFDRLIFALVALALFAVVVGNKQTAAAILAVGDAIKQLAQNIVSA